MAENDLKLSIGTGIFKPIADDINQLKKTVNGLTIHPGGGISVIKNSTGVHIVGQPSVGGSSTDNTFWAKIESYDTYATNQWTYSIRKATHISAGYSGWSGISSGTSITGTAYNTLEIGNSASGVQGCGINVDNLPSGFSLQPIGVNSIHKFYPITVGSGTEWWFSCPNSVDGTCPQTFFDSLMRRNLSCLTFLECAK